MTAHDQPQSNALRRAEAAEAKVLQAEDERNAALSTLADYEERVAQLERGGKELGRILDRTLRDALDASGRHDAIQEDGDGDWAVVWETLAGLRPRAEAAEAESARLASEQRELAAQVAALRSVVAKVEALADEWTAEADRLQEFADQGYYQGIVGARRTCRDDLRAVLADAAPDTATPGEGDDKAGER